MKKEKFAIIDANAVIHRAFHALPPLMTKDGVLVNAVYGFANILLKVLKDIKPAYAAVCFDVSRETFRTKIDANYKAQREHGPQELYDQIAMVKELVRAFNLPTYALKGYEADDLIGTVVNKIQTTINKEQRKIENYIVTGDMDTLQLVDENTKVYTLKKGIADIFIYDEEAVKERYGFGPERVVDYKALAGDPSDNIPGARGIGEKTATELIQKFGTIGELYKYVDKLSLEHENTERLKQKGAGASKGKIKDRVLKLLKEHKNDVLMSKELATIKCDVKMEFELEDARVRPFDAGRAAVLFQAWNFKSLIARIPLAEKIITKGQDSLFGRAQDKPDQHNEFQVREGYRLVDGEEEFKNFLVELSRQKELAVDTETDGLDPFECQLIGMSFSWEEGKGYYLPVGSNSKSKIQNPKLRNVLADEKVKKIGHNIKFDLEVLERAGFELKGIEFDTMVASYLLNPGSRQHNLDALAFSEFGYEMTPIEFLIGKGREQITMAQVDVQRVADYAVEDADYTWRLYKLLAKRLAKNSLTDLMAEIETPLIRVLAQMERNGVKIDEGFLQEMSKKLEAAIKKHELRIFKLAGVEFNVRSPMQLKEVLFDKLKIATTGLSKTKTGISTAASELDKLKGSHPIVDLIMEHRELAKLKSTYADALPKLINRGDGRLHTSYNQTVTATGRLSSSDPNLQNIPIRTELGREIRRAFVAPVGAKLVSIDYSQIELRIAAHMSGDKKMIEVFQQGEDIHRRTAAEIFNLAPERVTAEMRRKAKEINFGVLYGLGPRGLAARSGASYEEASDFIERYFTVFSGLKEYLEETVALAHEFEYVETLFGRKRFLPEINAEHQGLAAAAERMALNHPLQGTAADLIKLAMIAAARKIDEEYGAQKVKMIMQVHDELVFEIEEAAAEEIAGELKDIMETVYKFRVPLVAEVGLGRDWGECK